MLGWLIDFETGFLSSLVSSFLQPPLAGRLGVCLETRGAALLCRPTSSFLRYLGSSAHPPDRGRGPSALFPQWPFPGHPCLGFGRLGGGVLWNRKCSVESFLLRTSLSLPVPETLTDSYRPGDPQVTSRLKRVQLSS